MTAPALLRVHHYAPLSRANGPGRRAVIWVQGCTLGCPGCFNPHTHPATGGNLIAVEQLVEQCLMGAAEIEGITLTGGEPLQQPESLLAFLALLRKRSTLSVVVFSGYNFKEINRQKLGPAILNQIDLLFAGRYRQQAPASHGYLSSKNQTVHFMTNRYSAADLQNLPEAEVMISAAGELLFSGTTPLRWQDE